MTAIWILDSNCLIDMKVMISGADQWAAFRRLEDGVVAGEIALARQVIRELATVAHPDVPGVWAQGVRSLLVHPLDCGNDHLISVMSSPAAAVVDGSKDKDEADPYVIALALRLAAEGLAATVVTGDHVDRLPIKIAMTTACGYLDVPVAEPGEFLDAYGIPWKPKKERSKKSKKDDE